MGPPPSSFMAPLILKQSQTVPDRTFSLGTRYSQDWIVTWPGWSWLRLAAPAEVTWASSEWHDRCCRCGTDNCAERSFSHLFGSLRWRTGLLDRHDPF